LAFQLLAKQAERACPQQQHAARLGNTCYPRTPGPDRLIRRRVHWVEGLVVRISARAKRVVGRGRHKQAGQTNLPSNDLARGVSRYRELIQSCLEILPGHREVVAGRRFGLEKEVSRQSSGKSYRSIECHRCWAWTDGAGKDIHCLTCIGVNDIGCGYV